MDTAEVLPDEPLRAWDWRAELQRQQRSIPWLARQTDRADQTVYRYSWGREKPTIEWLRKAAEILKVSPE